MPVYINISKEKKNTNLLLGKKKKKKTLGIVAKVPVE